MTREVLGEVTLEVTTSVDLGDPETEEPYVEFKLKTITPFGTHKGKPFSCDLCKMAEGWQPPPLPLTGDPKTAWDHLVEDCIKDLPVPKTMCDGHVIEDLYQDGGTDFIEGCLPKSLFQQMSTSAMPQRLTAVGRMIFTSYSYDEGDDFDYHFELKSYHLEELPNEDKRLHTD